MSPIPRSGTPGTVGDMRLRRVLEDLVGADGSGASDATPGSDAGRAALDAAGHGNLAPELMGEALVHYADAASLEVADALSPIVTAAGAVPFDPELDPTPTPADVAAGGGFATDEEERRARGCSFPVAAGSHPADDEGLHTGLALV